MTTRTKKAQKPIKHVDKHATLKVIKQAQTDFLTTTGAVIDDTVRWKVASLLEKEFEKINRTPESDECTCDIGEKVDDVTFDEAIGILGDGHSSVLPAYATAVYAALGLEFNRKLMYHGYSDFFSIKGLRMSEGKEGTLTVDTGRMSEDIAETLGVRRSAGSYTGRGFQAQAYATAIRKKLKGEE